MNATARLISGRFSVGRPIPAVTIPAYVTATRPAPTEYAAAEATLREVVEALAPLQRRAGSSSEQEAARWLAGRFERAGCETQIDEERFLDGYAHVIGSLAAGGAVAGVAALSRRWRKAAALAGAAVTAAIADDISNGPRVFRRAISEPRPTWNVVAVTGDPAAARTLVVLGHHDAPPTGAIFDDRAQRWFGDKFPGIIERVDTSLPLWWPMLAAPALVAVGAAAGNRRLAAAGMAGSLIGAAVFADVARGPVSPGANDNLSAVAVLVALAERLSQEPVDGLRVMLASCGAEEVLQGGIHGFATRHFPSLDRERTWVLNLDTVGSPQLILLEGEGPLVMEDYHDRTFRDLIACAAEGVGAPVRRGMRSRTSTDAVIPSRAGYPTASLLSMDRYKALSNYHKMSDTPENLDYRTILHALVVTEAVARELARNPWIGH
jgi:Zn-dependent M28 family amino/carboxypeptidase